MAYRPTDPSGGLARLAQAAAISSSFLLHYGPPTSTLFSGILWLIIPTFSLMGCFPLLPPPLELPKCG